MAGEGSAQLRLELIGIEKDFGGVQALKGADLSARPAEILGLCGENGAGKSTLLKVLSGVYPAGSYRGEVRVGGVAVALESTRDAQERGIAIVHQELMLVPAMSVQENLLLGREPRRFGLIDDLALGVRARELLERFGFSQIDPAAPVSSLGIGLQQIIEIVRALSFDAQVLILDEPTAALTTEEAARLHEWLKDLRARGTTCIYVSHRMDEIFSLCDRVTVLRDGRTVGTVVTAESSPDAIINMMVGRTLEIRPPENRAAAGPPLVQIDSLSVKGALSDISLAVGAGELVALVGALGSGRTALLSTLFGCAETPVRGDVRLSGKSLSLSGPRDAIQSGIAYLPEDRKGRGLLLDMTVAENLSLPTFANTPGLFVDDERESNIAREQIAALSVRGTANVKVGTLSGGNQQKVVLGKWLAMKPRLLLLDEPTRGVDVGAREEIYNIIERLLADGVAVLMASSDLQEVRRLADRILVLQKGRIAAELPRGASEEEMVRLSTFAKGKAA